MMKELVEGTTQRISRRSKFHKKDITSDINPEGLLSRVSKSPVKRATIDKIILEIIEELKIYDLERVYNTDQLSAVFYGRYQTYNKIIKELNLSKIKFSDFNLLINLFFRNTGLDDLRIHFEYILSIIEKIKVIESQNKYIQVISKSLDYICDIFKRRTKSHAKLYFEEDDKDKLRLLETIATEFEHNYLEYFESGQIKQYSVVDNQIQINEISSVYENWMTRAPYRPKPLHRSFPSVQPVNFSMIS